MFHQGYSRAELGNEESTRALYNSSQDLYPFMGLARNDVFPPLQIVFFSETNKQTDWMCYNQVAGRGKGQERPPKNGSSGGRSPFQSLADMMTQPERLL